MAMVREPPMSLGFCKAGATLFTAARTLVQSDSIVFGFDLKYLSTCCCPWFISFPLVLLIVSLSRHVVGV